MRVACDSSSHVAYAINVHKAQDMTLPICVLNIAERGFAAGLRYVSVSRVKSLDSLLFSMILHTSMRRPAKRCMSGAVR